MFYLRLTIAAFSFFISACLLTNTATAYSSLDPDIDPASVSERVKIIIDMDRLTLTLFDGTEPLQQYPVAMGKYETPTPVGNWEIVSKDIKPAAMLGTRWMGLNIPYGVYGIHGTYDTHSIGSFASHGCIRMFNHDVEKVFPLVENGTPVTIVGSPFGAPGTPPAVLKMGDTGPAVLEAQKVLKRLGYLQWTPDGFWGQGTEKAVKRLREEHGLKGQAVIDDTVYRLLGF